jgi:hypothetical protein
MRIASAKTAIAGALLALALAGCVVAPAGPGGEVVAYSTPPPVHYEAIGVAPTPGYFWVGGNWFWERGAYNWHPGYWQAPRPGYYWAPHTWHHVGNEYHMQPGHWVRH